MGQMKQLFKNRDTPDIMSGQQPVHSLLILLAQMPATKSISSVL